MPYIACVKSIFIYRCGHNFKTFHRVAPLSLPRQESFVGLKVKILYNAIPICLQRNCLYTKFSENGAIFAEVSPHTRMNKFINTLPL